MTKDNQYVPGVCNIGIYEIRRRKIFSFVGYIMFFGMLIYFFVMDTPPLLRATLAIPALIQSINYLQVTNKFCVNFGLRQMYNFSDSSNTQHITDDESIKKDYEKSLRIILLSLLISVLAGTAGILSSYIKF